MADFRPPPGKWRNDEKFSLFFKLVTFADFSAFTAIIRKCTQKQEGFRKCAVLCPQAETVLPLADGPVLLARRQLRRAVVEPCGPAGIRELPAQDETAAYAQPSSAVSNSLKPERSPPRRHNARTSERCPCVVRWDAVVTVSCEAFCENNFWVLSLPWVTTTVCCEAFCENWRPHFLGTDHVTTTASCEAFCEIRSNSSSASV